MRRVNVVDGIMQRINNIVGSGNSGELNEWSVQMAMLSNISRLITALVGNAPYGRVLGGLEITAGTGKAINISAGYGITVNGGLVSLARSLSYDLEADGGYMIYLRHSIIATDSTSPGHMETQVINGDPVVITFDEIGTVKGNVVSSDDIVVKSTAALSSHDLVYLGFVEVDGTIDSIAMSDDRGFYPSMLDNKQGIIMTNESGVTKRVQLNSGANGFIFSDI